jgi:hypothetical protein
MSSFKFHKWFNYIFLILVPFLFLKVNMGLFILEVFFALGVYIGTKWITSLKHVLYILPLSLIITALTNWNKLFLIINVVIVSGIIAANITHILIDKIVISIKSRFKTHAISA